MTKATQASQKLFAISFFAAEKKKRKAMREMEWWAFLATEHHGFLIERRSLREWMGDPREKIPSKQERVGRSG